MGRPWPAFFASVMVAMAATVPAEAEKLIPKDECSADPKLAAFNRQLRDIVAKRDSKRLTALLAPSIKNSFGGSGGIQEFEEMWDLNRSQKSNLWDELSRAMNLGCAREKTFGAMPYMFARIGDKYEPFNSYVAVGNNIAVRAAPSRTASQIATLDWDIVSSPDGEGMHTYGTGDDWLKVKSPAGKIGFVHLSFLRSPTDYRIIVQPVRGKLMITSFVAGD